MKTQAAIVGGGPGASTCAIHLAAQGIDSIIVERESFPRFHIGESLTGGSADLLREMGFEDEMIRRRYPTKYGITIYGPAGKNGWWLPIRTRGLDGKEEQRETNSWQVLRSDFDTFMLEQAVARGAKLVRGRAVAPIMDADGRMRGVRVVLADGTETEIHSDVVVDSSGQQTFLANAGVTGPKNRGRYSKQIAIYSHFRNIVRDEGDAEGNTITWFQQRHHWCWFIPLVDKVTSIGFVVPGSTFRASKQSLKEFLVDQLHTFHHGLAARTKDAEMVQEVHATSNYSYEVENFTGNGWLCIGDAHRFVDPLFSYGLNITMVEGREAARIIPRYLSGDLADSPRPFEEFEAFAARGVNMAQTFLDGFWDTTLAFGFMMREYWEDFIDMFAGRMWEEQEYAAITAMRARLNEYYLDHPDDAPTREPILAPIP